MREKGDDRYVNIDLTENKLDLQIVKEQLVAQRDSRDQSIEKVKARLDEVAPKKLKRALA